MIFAGWRSRVQAALSALSSPGGFAVAVVIYLSVLFVLRITLFPAASEDDAETLLLTQSLEAGYKPGQPPLYIWLSYGLTQIFGPTLSVILALKFTCLAAIYVLTHRLTDLFTGEGKWAAVAGMSVLGIYSLSWGAVLNYSQTVLLAALSLAFVYALTWLGIRRSSGWAAWIILGVITGAGILTKYNFAILVVAVLAAALMDRDLREKLLGLKGLVAILAAAVIVSPHVLWLLDGSMAGYKITTVAPASGNAIMVRLNSVWGMGVSVVSILSPLLIFMILFFPRAAWKIDDRNEDHLRWRRLCERSFWLLLAIMTVAVLVSGIPEIRNHWFIVLVPFPAYAVLRIAAVYPLRPDGQLSARLGGFLCLLAALGLAVGGGMTARALTQPAKCGNKCKMVVPYAQLADGLRQVGFSGGTIYVHDFPAQVGGNLRQFFPDSRIVSYKYPTYMPPPRRAADDRKDGQCLAVWLLGAPGQSPDANSMLGKIKGRMGFMPSQDDTMLSLDVRLPGRDEPFTYGYILIDDLPRQGMCR